MKFLLLLLPLFLSSCATLLNGKRTAITINTDRPATFTYLQDTTEMWSGKNRLRVYRSGAVMKITAHSDSLSKVFWVLPQNSFLFQLNLFANYGLGKIVDRDNPKRYSYPKHVRVNFSDTMEIVNRKISTIRPPIEAYQPPKKKAIKEKEEGEIDLHLSLPHINTFTMLPEHESRKGNIGFWGISAGLDYYHRKHSFYSISVAAVSDFLIPFPAPVDLSGENELMTSRYISFSKNHLYKRFAFGYGLSFAKNAWDFRYFDRFDPPPPTREPVKKTHSAIGFLVPFSYRLGSYFSTGLVYRPTFFRPSMDIKFRYEHLVSLELALKLPIGSN